MALLVKRGPVKSEQSTKLWDYQVYLLAIWLDHLKNNNSQLYEKSVQHGVSSPRSCCSGRSHIVEVRKKK